jgi:hypothetical protein
VSETWLRRWTVGVWSGTRGEGVCWVFMHVVRMEGGGEDLMCMVSEYHLRDIGWCFVPAPDPMFGGSIDILLTYCFTVRLGLSLQGLRG